jgi:hypothetical protein
MRFRAVVLLVAALSVSCGGDGGGGLFRQYEYEEEMYLSLDGSATIYVNSSVAALNALRGSSFDSAPSADVDRGAVRDYFTTAVTRVPRRPALSRRSNRRFVHVRVDVDDVRRLPEATPFAWSSYRFGRDGASYLFEQTVGAAAGKAGTTNWSGSETVAFRLHVPSRVLGSNAAAGNLKRGNILVWEQPLAERLRGAPLMLEARMEPQSILYRTLALFGVTIVAVVLAFVALIWWILRRGGKPAQV